MMQGSYMEKVQYKTCGAVVRVDLRGFERDTRWKPWWYILFVCLLVGNR